MSKWCFRVSAIPNLTGLKRRALGDFLAGFFRLGFPAIDTNKHTVGQVGVIQRNIARRNFRIEDAQQFIGKNQLVARFLIDGDGFILCVGSTGQ